MQLSPLSSYWGDLCLPTSGHDAWHRQTNIRITQASEKISNRKYLLKVAQTIWYLARPGWPLQEDGNEIDSNSSQLLLLYGNHDPKIEHTQQHKITMYISDPIYTITIAMHSISRIANIACMTTVNKERFAELNFHGFRSFQEQHKSFSMNISATLK